MRSSPEESSGRSIWSVWSAMLARCFELPVGLIFRPYTSARSWKTESGSMSPYTWFVSR